MATGDEPLEAPVLPMSREWRAAEAKGENADAGGSAGLRSRSQLRRLVLSETTTASIS